MRFIILQLLVALSTTSIYGSTKVDYWGALNEIVDVTTIIIAATFSRCLLVTCSCKGTVYSLKKLDFIQNRIYNPQALSSVLALLGHHSLGPLGYKFYRFLYFKVLTIMYYLKLRAVSYKHLVSFSGQWKQHYNKNKHQVSHKRWVFCGSIIIIIFTWYF